jgi:hypothetical protein
MTFVFYSEKISVMKRVLNVAKICFVVLFSFYFTGTVKAQLKDSALKSSIDAKRFVFYAQSAMPMKGGSRHLSTGYELKVSPDTLISYLPYYGRAYSAGYGGSDAGGYDFTSKKFDYDAKPGKKGGWEISIKPKDVQDVQEFTLSISTDGYATLRANSNTRQPISFRGYIAGK